MIQQDKTPQWTIETLHCKITLTTQSQVNLEDMTLVNEYIKPVNTRITVKTQPRRNEEGKFEKLAEGDIEGSQKQTLTGTTLYKLNASNYKNAHQNRT